MGDVILKRIELDDQNSLVKIQRMINNDEDLRNVFSGQRNTVSRLLNACYVAFIQQQKNTIGFVMIVDNARTRTQEVDIGILKPYRKQGYGTQALSLLKDIVIANDLVVEAQVSNTNTAAIRTVVNNGGELIRQDQEHSYFALGQTESEKKK
ncbi:MAG: GNAT family N-acetyltransferase [Firmicutes bacterium]|nr:GNAT family N-acetyltransferase [Bacillota bacterium]